MAMTAPTKITTAPAASTSRTSTSTTLRSRSSDKTSKATGGMPKKGRDQPGARRLGLRNGHPEGARCAAPSALLGSGQVLPQGQQWLLRYCTEHDIPVQRHAA